MPNGDKLKPKTTREHLLSIYGYITGLKNDVVFTIWAVR
jgi:hypothetical protein